MAVIIKFELETERDVLTPMTIASALVEDIGLGVSDLEEIAKHLRTYVKHAKREELKECQ